ncbi:branched-chain amino acid ABC transporter permease [Archaeoglobales archaeon ex4484_92]|nr:MAG: branched-chain amino acid ABC transporter permease [Archaeoglobales archaeon ex4484_92]
MKSKTVAIFFVFSAILPFFVPEAYLYIIGLAYLFAIIAISWDLMVGYTGQVNLGHTTFVGVGAYIAALLQVPERIGLNFDVPPLLSILASGLVTSLIGLVIGVGGEEGFSIGTENAIYPTILGKYYISLLILVISLIIILKIVDSNLGLKFKAIRDSEELAESLGINTTKYKVLAFVISSFFAGIAGAAIVHYRITVSPDLYDIPLMLLVILSTVIGGIGTILGPLFSAIIIYLAKSLWMRSLISFIGLPINDEILLYSLLILFGITMPRGIYEGVVKFYKSRSDGGKYERAS